LEAGQPDVRESPTRTSAVAADSEGDLVVCALPHEVPPRVLRQVAGTPVALDLARGRLQQARRDLGERCLSAPVRAQERCDLAPAQLEPGAVQHRRPAGVCEANVLETHERLLLCQVTVCYVARFARKVGRAVVSEPVEGLLTRSVEQDAAALHED